MATFHSTSQTKSFSYRLWKAADSRRTTDATIAIATPETTTATSPLTHSASWESGSTTPVGPTTRKIEESQRRRIPWCLNAKEYGVFDQERDWGFAYSSVPADLAVNNYVIEDVEGKVPLDIRGTFYKIGPGNFERNGRRFEHVLDGDGFVASFHFDGTGRVQYRGRFVETEYYMDERVHDEIKYRNVFGTQRAGGILSNAFDLVLKNVANTNVLKWSGRLFALWEGGRPYEIDPVSLETLEQTNDGPYKNLGHPNSSIRGVTIDQGGALDKIFRVGRTFTAHPHVYDDDTLVAFMAESNAQTKEEILEFIEYNKCWEKKSSTRFSYPDGLPPHDFSISDHYYCFFQNPFGSVDALPYLMGLKSPTQVMRLQLRKPTKLWIISRGSEGEKSFSVNVPPYFNIHTVAKAEEKDGNLWLYSNGWDLSDQRYFPSSTDSVPFLGSWGGPYPDFTNGIVPPALLYRTVIDLQTQELVSHDEVVPGCVIEFPLQDEREPDILYMSIASTDYTSLPGTGVCKVDLTTSSVLVWWAEHRVFTNESVPIPKSNGERGSWILTPLYDSGKKRFTLAILDSENFEAGPVCRLNLKHHVSYGLHSTFATA